MSDPAQQRPREPKYYLVKRHLLDVIEMLPPGAAVPTERDLAVQLGTSRTTIRRAMLDLVAEGRLVRRHGSGSYVAEPKMSWPLHLSSFTSQAAASGLAASTELISAERIRPDEDIARRLGVGRGPSVFRIERLRLADDLPIALETSHLSAARFPRLTAYMRRAQSLYQVLAAIYHVAPASAEQTISTAPASPRVAELLRTDTGAPMLMLSRHSFDADGAPVEWVTSWYRGDRIVLVAHMMRPRGEAAAGRPG